MMLILLTFQYITENMRFSTQLLCLCMINDSLTTADVKFPASKRPYRT